MPETHYFSVVSISDSGMKSSYLRQQCSDIYGVHQEIWKLFPSNPDQKRDFLFREVDRKFPPTFYLLSQRKPEDEKNNWDIKTKEFSPKLKKGTGFFLIKGNARITRKEVHQSREGKMRLSTIFLWTLKNSSGKTIMVKIQ